MFSDDSAFVTQHVYGKMESFSFNGFVDTDFMMKKVIQNFMFSGVENELTYNEMLRRGIVLKDPSLTFSQGMAIRVTLPIGVKVSLSRVLAFDSSDRNAPYEIALINPNDNESLWHAPEILQNDGETVKVVGSNAQDFDVLAKELWRINNVIAKHVASKLEAPAGTPARSPAAILAEMGETKNEII